MENTKIQQRIDDLKIRVSHIDDAKKLLELANPTGRMFDAIWALAERRKRMQQDIELLTDVRDEDM
jgi:hypothetical protein